MCVCVCVCVCERQVADTEVGSVCSGVSGRRRLILNEELQLTEVSQSVRGQPANQLSAEGSHDNEHLS